MKKNDAEADPMIGDKTVSQWDRRWERVEGGFGTPQPQYRHEVGLFRARLHGEVVALGSGTDRRGGLAKRLSDFRRPSPSGRNHRMGELINSHLGELKAEVLVTGSGQQARDLAKKLRKPMIKAHNPKWNVPAKTLHELMMAHLTGKG